MRAWLLLALPFLSGCVAGKAAYALYDARSACREAAEAGAPDAAPHAWTLAEAYRRKAVEEFGRSAYREAEALAREAAAHAAQARDLALFGSEEPDLLREIDRDEATLPDEAGRPAGGR